MGKHLCLRKNSGEISVFFRLEIRLRLSHIHLLQWNFDLECVALKAGFISKN